ncbi:MAG: TetR/AcrR family transcriptional regulator [Actinomycetia bacterium]|nr:TetR/AcrR family transcriptional regulator [Actinomycetes bacterium]MCP4225547.1 TetR/AcrR family transcriptional regulator [Actinomycetes bacterium]MCP5032060.1 TetR/AcrR family transcriptional regulator [Actinomycetes bacterium]
MARDNQHGERGRRRVQLSADLVIETAATIVDSEGIEALSLTRVAKDLGTSQPALYRHLDGYDALIRALGLRSREILAGRLAAAAVGLAREDAVRAMGVAWRRMVQDHPGIYAATDRYPVAGDPELEAAIDQIVATLGQALIGFDLAEDEVVHVARTLRSAFHGFSHLEAGVGFPLKQDLDDSFDRLLELLCTGIRTLGQA